MPLVIVGTRASAPDAARIRSRASTSSRRSPSSSGSPSPPDLPGRSVLAEGPERPAVCETDGLANNGTRVDLVAVRRPAWKLIYAPARQSAELYDLGTDPGEHAPLPVEAGEGPALRRTLDDFVRTAPPAPAHTGRDPALLEKLRALGYAN